MPNPQFGERRDARQHDQTAQYPLGHELHGTFNHQGMYDAASNGDDRKARMTQPPDAKP